MENVQRIGEYVLMEKIGSGGFSTVYKCRHRETNALHAIKIGNDAINEEYEAKGEDVDTMMHMQEWQAYKALGFGKETTSSRHGIPEVVETGIARLPGKELRPYLVMQLLGKSLGSQLSKPDFTRTRFFHVAHDAIEIVGHLHDAGYIHRDIKPSNFCFGREGDGENGCPLFILDLGFACEPPKRTDRKVAEFLGTPDYASGGALRSVRQSYRDDMESLGYMLFEMWMRDLPWYLTSSPSARAGGWTRHSLRKMAEKRERKWKALVREKQIPSFLIAWLHRCKGMEMVEKPDYAVFHRLVDDEREKLKNNVTKKRKVIDLPSDPQDKDQASEQRLCTAEE